MPILAPPSGLNTHPTAAYLASEVIAETSLGITFGHSAPSQRLNTRAYLASKNGSKNGGGRRRSDGSVRGSAAVTSGPGGGGGRLKPPGIGLDPAWNRIPLFENALHPVDAADLSASRIPPGQTRG